MMRIGFDATWYNGSGVGTYIAGLLAAMCEYRDDLTLVVFEDAQRPVPGIDGRGLTRIAMRSRKFTLSEQFEFRDQCKQNQIEVFHSPYQYGVPLLLSCPLVITVHDLIPFLFRTRDWHKQLLAVPLVKLGYHAAAVRAQHIIADSETTADDVRTILGVPASKITPIHLAAGSAFHNAPSPGEREQLARQYGLAPPYVVVGSAGCNWRTKDFDTALEAIALARRHSRISFQVAIYGPRTAMDKLKRPDVLSELNVHYLGYVPVEDMAALFRNAALFVMSSLYEGFGLPILEAMSCGCPVVTSNGGSLAEVAGNGAWVFNSRDAEGMAQAIVALLSNENERERWRNRALARAAQFSWRKAAQQTIGVYRSICNCADVNNEAQGHELLADASNRQSV